MEGKAMRVIMPFLMIALVAGQATIPTPNIPTVPGTGGGVQLPPGGGVQLPPWWWRPASPLAAACFLLAAGMLPPGGGVLLPPVLPGGSRRASPVYSL
ncbi:hypothetical protein CCACVL1_06026, partial [Corchorus capsularis]